MSHSLNQDPAKLPHDAIVVPVYPPWDLVVALGEEGEDDTVTEFRVTIVGRPIPRPGDLLILEVDPVLEVEVSSVGHLFPSIVSVVYAIVDCPKDSLDAVTERVRPVFDRLKEVYAYAQVGPASAETGDRSAAIQDGQAS